MNYFQTGTDLNDNYNNMNRSDTVKKNKTQNQTIRNESVEKTFETNITKNNNNIPTQSSIPSKTQILKKNDIDEKLV